MLPDRTYLERFSQEPIYPNQQYQLIQFGQPAVRAYEGPRSVEDVYLEIMERLGLPGVGEGAVPKGKKDSGQTASLSSEEDYWLKMAANIAYAGEPVPDADAEELALFERVRARALGDAFDLDAWKAAVDEDEWPKVVYVLNRGGRFG
ncbi:MAG: molybdopterin dinucleotide-binding protein, partial [Eggerthellaceae bacterium]